MEFIKRNIWLREGQDDENIWIINNRDDVDFKIDEINPHIIIDTNPWMKANNKNNRIGKKYQCRIKKGYLRRTKELQEKDEKENGGLLYFKPVTDTDKLKTFIEECKMIDKNFSIENALYILHTHNYEFDKTLKFINQNKNTIKTKSYLRTKKEINLFKKTHEIHNSNLRLIKKEFENEGCPISMWRLVNYFYLKITKK